MKNNIRCSHFQLSALAIVGLIYSLQAAAADYTITDLGTLGGTSSYAKAINNSGQVVGKSFYGPGDFDYHAFLYTGNGMTDLGTFGGTHSDAYGINNSGQVVGYASFAGDTVSQAFLYSNGVMTNIEASFAYDINDSGQIVIGSSIYYDGVITSLGSLGGASGTALDINNNGQAVGEVFTNGYEGKRAFLSSNGVMTNLGTLGGSYSLANAINDNGQIVGQSLIAGDIIYRPFLYISGVMVDIGNLGGTYSGAQGINNSGQVVGWSRIADDTANHAFLYSGGVLHDLNNMLPDGSGWTLSVAEDINDLGQIVGYGTINGQQHAYLMTPTSVVPIPSAFWLFGSGLVGLFGFMRRSNKIKN